MDIRQPGSTSRTAHWIRPKQTGLQPSPSRLAGFMGALRPAAKNPVPLDTLPPSEAENLTLRL
jgi:hypothetical protein